MEKEFKSCMGVFLRADLTGHGQFLPKRVGGPCPVGSALKRTPVEDFNYFSMIHNISTTYQKIGDLFCPVHISGLSLSVLRILKIKMYSSKLLKPSHINAKKTRNWL